MEHRFLCYGDYVLIYSEDQSGFLISQGFADPFCLVQQIDYELKFSITSKFLVFQVLPKLSYDNSREYRRVKKEVNFSQEIGIDRGTLGNEELVRLSDLQKRISVEDEHNERTIQQRAGEPITYGQEVIFRHQQSKMLLKGRQMSADGDRSSFKVQLSELGGSGVYFKIASKFKIRQDGDRIEIGDQLIFENTKLKQYLHVSDKNFQYFDVPQNLDSLPISTDFRPHPLQVAVNFEVNISVITSSWKIVPYSKFRGDTTALSGGEIVNLIHTESEGFLTCDGTDFTKDGQAEVYVKQSTEEFDKSSAFSMFIVENCTNNQEDMGKQCTWQAKGDNNHFRLKHLITGRFVGILDSGNKKVLSLCKHISEIVQQQVQQEIDIPSKFQLEATTVENDNNIHNNSIALIKSSSYGIYLSTSHDEWGLVGDEFERHGSQLSIQNYMDTNFYEPMNEEDNFSSRRKVNFNSNKSQEDAFIIQKADKNSIQEIQFITSCQYHLSLYCQLFYNKIEPDRVHQNTVESLLKKLIKFVIKSEDNDPYICEGIPYKRRQVYLRELGIIDLVCNIIYLPFYSQIYNINNLKPNDLITKICQLCYRLLYHVSKDNRENGNYCAQWLGLFIYQSHNTSDDNDIYAETTIAQILNNNKKQLERVVSCQIIEKFVTLCLNHKKHERYLNILTALCACDGEAITSNQNLISELILQDANVSAQILMPLRSVQGDIQVYVHELNGYISLVALSQEAQNERVFLYFLALLALVAELALGRNHLADSLKDVYTLNYCYKCIQDSQLSHRLRAAFVKVLLHLHMDQGDAQKIIIPNYTRVWNEINIDQEFSIQHSKIPIPASFQDIKEYAIQFLREIKGVQYLNRRGSNMLVFQMLTLVKFMIEHGFYSNIDDLEELIDPLIDLLNGTNDNLHDNTDSLKKAPSSRKHSSHLGGRENNEQRYRLTLKNKILMDCKETICEILGVLTELRVDARLTQFLGDFKRDCSAQGQVLSPKPTITGKIPIVPSFKDISLMKQSTYGKQNSMMNFNKIMSIGRFDYEEDDPEDDDYVIDESIRMPILWFDEIMENNQLDIQVASTKDFIAVLLDIMLYQNPTLANEAFKLLLHNYQQRERLIYAMKKVQLLEQENTTIPLDQIREDLQILSKNAEDAENWLGKNFLNNQVREQGEILSKDQSTEQIHKTTNQILKQFSYLCRDINDQRMVEEDQNDPEPEEEEKRGQESFKMRYDIEDLIEEIDEDIIEMSCEPEIFTSYENPNKENQRLLRNLMAYNPALEIIQQRGINRNFYSKQRHHKTLRYCYIFLAKFCRQNNTNQQILSQHVDWFLQDIKRNVFAITLIKEIYRDNLKLLIEIPFNVCKQIVKGIDDTPISGKKSYILKSLETFIRINDKVLKSNQTLVVNQLASSNRRNIVSLYYSDQECIELKSQIETITRNLNNPSQSELLVEIPDKIIYLSTLLEIMAIASEDKSAQAELICQQLLNLQHYNKLLQLSGQLWPLKQSLILFFLHVYLDIEFSMQEDEIVLWNTVETLSQDLTYINETYYLQSAGYKSHMARFKLLEGNINIGEYASKYVFKAIMPCLHEIFIKRGNNLPVNKYHDVLNNIIQMIYSFNNIAQSNEDKQVTCNILHLVEDIDKLQKFMNPNFIINHVASTHHTKTGQSNTNNTYQQYQSKAHQFNYYIRKLSQCNLMQDALELEFEGMIKAILRIKQKSIATFGEEFTLETSDVLRALINLLLPNDINIDKQLISFGLKILRKTIEVENKEHSNPASEWETEDWIMYKQMIVERQNNLGQLGVVNLIIKTIILQEDQKIINECILLSIATLLGGNSFVQDQFLEVLSEDTSNQFVLKLKDLLISLFERVRVVQQYRLATMMKQLKRNSQSGQSPLRIIHDSNSTDSEDEQMDANFEDKEQEAVDEFNFQLLVNMLRFIQLLCEGHHQGSQNFLREQYFDGNLHNKSFDFITFMSTMLISYIKMMRKDNLALGFQIIDSLTEVVQGPCRENQRVLSQPKIIDCSKDVIVCLKKEDDANSRGFNLIDDSEDISNLKSKVVNFLLSLVEGDADVEILQRIAESLDFKKIKERMCEVFSLYLYKDLGLDVKRVKMTEILDRIKGSRFQGTIDEGFNLYILMHTLADNYPPAKAFIDESSLDKFEALAYKFFKLHTGRIEVVVNKMLTRTYFPIQPVCSHISKDSKERLLTTPSRDSPANKIIDALQIASDIIEEMTYAEKLGYSKFQLTEGRLLGIRDFQMVLTIIVNYILLFNYDYDDDEQDRVLEQWCKNVITVLQIAQIILNSIVLLGWFRTKSEITLIRGWRNISKGEEYVKPIIDYNVEQLSYNDTLAILFSRGPNAVEFNQGQGRNFGNLITSFAYFAYSTRIIFTDFNFIYLLYYLGITVAGFFDYFFLSIMILDVVYRVPTLRNVLTAVTKNWPLLAMTCLLGMIIIYIYSLIGFYIDYDMWYDRLIGDYGSNQCQSLWHCFLTTTNEGLRMGGGVGEAISKISFEDKTIYYERVVYDIAFFLMVIIILLNIIFGIIIDTFAQLRDYRNMIKEDLRDRCFVCNVEGTVFDRNTPQGFTGHIKKDHNIWQYLYFLVHLKTKDPTEFNGTESHCSNCISEEDISWIPLNNALSIQHLLQKDEEEAKTIEYLRKRISEMSIELEELTIAASSKSKDN